jgi:diacylglycerol kinase (ATP)
MLIIFNPLAAKGKALSHKEEIEEYFTSQGATFDIAITQNGTDAITIAKKAVHTGYKIIVAAGGDGTVNEVVDGVVRAIRELKLNTSDAPAIGILPVGRGNDFAYIAKIPKNIKKACDLILHSEPQFTDYGELFGGDFPEGRCFINGVGIGFEPMVNYAATSFKRVSGMASYFLGLIKVMMNYPKAIPVTITTDDETLQFETQQISLCNGRRMGSAFLMGPYAEIDDGKLDIVYAKKGLNSLNILWHASKFLIGTQLKTEAFSMTRSKEVTITTDQDRLICHADGEGVSLGCSSIKVTLFSRELKIIRK